MEESTFKPAASEEEQENSVAARRAWKSLQARATPSAAAGAPLQSASLTQSTRDKARASFSRFVNMADNWTRLKVDRLPAVASEIIKRGRIAKESSATLALRESMHRMRTCITLQCLIAVLNIGLSVALLEVRYRTNFSERGEFACNMIKLANSLLTALIVAITFAYFSARVQFLIHQNLLPPGTGVLSSGMGRRAVLEMLILAVHAPPFWNTNPERGLYTEGLLCSATIARCYLFVRLLYLRSDLFTTHGRFIASLTNCKLDSMLAFKIALKARPMRVLLTLFFLTVLVCAYLTWIFERWIPAAVDGESELADFWSCLYLTLITVYTVGYGDVSPVTPLGRAMAVIDSALGTVLTAILVAVISQELMLSGSENLVMAYLERSKYKSAIRQQAAAVIQRAWRSARNSKSRAVPGDLLHGVPLSSSVAEGGHHAADVYVKIRDWRKLRRLGRQLGLEGGGARPVDIEVSAVRADVANVTQKVDKLLEWAEKLEKRLAGAGLPARPSDAAAEGDGEASDGGEGYRDARSPSPPPPASGRVHFDSPGTPAAAAAAAAAVRMRPLSSVDETA
eukprot:tig00021179_g19278.t1